MKIAVLGHTGFLGKNVTELLHQNNTAYQGASRSNGVDLRDVKQVEQFLAAVQPDVILHCAAHVGSFNYVTENASQVMVDNTQLVLSVYEAVARVCPRAVVVHPLANCVYPATAEHFVDTAWEQGPVHHTVLPFATTRRLTWAAGESFRISHGTRSVYLLVPNMYGPHDSTDPNQTSALDALVSKFIQAKRQEQSEVTLWGTGAAIREWLYAPDMARLLLEVAHNPWRDELSTPINIAQNTGLSIRELALIIQQATGYEGQVRYDHSKPDGAAKKVMDDTRFQQAFPAFEFTDFQAGLKNTIQYYQSINW